MGEDIFLGSGRGGEGEEGEEDLGQETGDSCRAGLGSVIIGELI